MARGTPVVDEHEAEDVVGGFGGVDWRAERRPGLADEAELELDFQAGLSPNVGVSR